MNASDSPHADAPEATDRVSIRAVGGSLALAGCAVLVCIAFVDETGGLPFSMPRSWYSNRALWYLIILATFVTGCMLLRQPGSVEQGGRKSSTKRFRRVIVYTRRNCHLCDEAMSLLESYRSNLPPLETIDVDSNPTLVAQFGSCVPVIEIDGKVRFRGRVNPVLLKRLIAHGPVERTGEIQEGTA